MDALTEKIIGCAIEVHRLTGPGLLESAYEQCFAHEMDEAGIIYERQKSVPVFYKQVRLDCGFRLDFLVAGSVIVELKSVEVLQGIHLAQILTYMKLANIGTGLLINFNERRLVDGIKRLKL